MANADAAPTLAVFQGGEMNAMAEKQPSFSTIQTGISITPIRRETGKRLSFQFRTIIPQNRPVRKRKSHAFFIREGDLKKTAKSRPGDPDKREPLP